MLVAMGFPEDEARVALRAAFGNADRAVEYLTTGIPESVLASVRCVCLCGCACVCVCVCLCGCVCV